MQPKVTLYLDLDRTLFITDRVNELLDEACERLYGILPTKRRQDQPAYSTRVGDQHFYRFFDQLEQYGVARDRAVRELRQAFAGLDFLYPDARKLLAYLSLHQWPTVVLSLGDQDFQTFKYSLVPELQRLPIICTEALKGEYFRGHTETALIVDDRKIAGLPETCQGVLIDRTEHKLMHRQTDGYLVISDLTRVEELLRAYE